MKPPSDPNDPYEASGRYLARLAENGFQVSEMDMASHEHLLEYAIPALKALERLFREASFTSAISSRDEQIVAGAIRVLKSVCLPESMLHVVEKPPKKFKR